MEVLKVLIVCFQESVVETKTIVQAPKEEPSKTDEEAKANQIDREENSVLKDLQEIKQCMKPLIYYIRNDPSQEMRQSIQFDQIGFQNLILQFLLGMMDQENLGAEGSEIVEQSLTIWVSCIYSNPTLFDYMTMPPEGSVVSEFLSKIVKRGIM